MEIHNYVSHREISESTHRMLKQLSSNKRPSSSEEINNLIISGFTPNLILFHGGMGLSLYIRKFYSSEDRSFEWFFRSETQKWATNREDIDTRLMAYSRNFPITQELALCDKCVVPTDWQKKQFPKVYSDHLNVIFDGIDNIYFHADNRVRKAGVKIKGEENEDPIEINSTDKVVTYMTRGMEPIRGFPEFMRTVPKILGEDKNIRVIIAGRDRAAYSYQAPAEGGSWKQFMISELGNFEGKERVHFTGLLNYNDYRLMLQRTDLHCYWTRPYVTSWSMFEAAACNSPLMVNKSGATSNIVVREQEIEWVDIDEDTDIIARKMIERLNKKEKDSESNLRKQFYLLTA